MDSIKTNNLKYQVGGQNILRQKGQFELQRDHLMCVSGPSGGGKTTLLNLLSGLLAPSEGEIYWGCDCLSDIDADKRRLQWIGMIFQEPRLAKQLSGWENIYLPLKIAGCPDRLDENLLQMLLGTFFLKEGDDFNVLAQKLSRPVQTYSSGQMQRIAIIRALMAKPKFIFADEILNSVEPELQDKTWQAIKAFCKVNQIGFILVTHNQTLLNDPDFTHHLTIEDGVFGL